MKWLDTWRKNRLRNRELRLIKKVASSLAAVQSVMDLINAKQTISISDQELFRKGNAAAASAQAELYMMYMRYPDLFPTRIVALPNSLREVQYNGQ